MNGTALILDGRIQGDGIANQPLELAAEWLAQSQWTSTVFRLSELEIAPCIGCFGCWIKTPGECLIDDAGRDVARRIVGSDLVVYLTPVLFGGYSFELKKAVDRSIPIISPLFQRVDGEVHHKKRYAQYPRILALGWMKSRTADEVNLFEAVVRRNAINMHAPKALAVVFEAEESHETMKQRIAPAFSEVVGE